VGVAAEVFVCKRAAEETGGKYGVASSEGHFEEIVSSHSPPPAVSPIDGSTGGSELVQMGFPQRLPDEKALAVFIGSEAVLQAGGFVCPRCKARVRELPCECHVCKLTLISSPHLARSYHHLFPVMPYEELSTSELRSIGKALATTSGIDLRISCYGCMRDLTRSLVFAMRNDQGQKDAPMGSLVQAISLSGGAPMVLRCPACREIFCFDCDVFCHDALHNCPGCEINGRSR
jgi:transcription initiation factor TFIIH subunit 2